MTNTNPPPPATGRIVAFDFDGTLTRGDSLLPFLWRHLGAGGLARALLLSSPWLAAFALRLIDNERAKTHLLRAALAGRSLVEVEAWADTFARDHLPGQWTPWALARLRAHQAAGDCCVMVSASPDVYLRAAARSLGIPVLLCTELEIDAQGRLTGRMHSRNCHGAEKVNRLREWLGARAPADGQPLVDEAYGNSSGDHAMLNAARVGWMHDRPWSPRV
ncbi:MAG: hypothetical protein RJA98_3817 [Pseudomonadota bacterium]